MDTIRVRVRPLPGLTPINSTCIKAIGYDAARSILRVQFHKPKDSPPYDFPDVPSEHYHGLLRAKSKGKYFARHIDRRGAKQAE